MVGRIGHGAIPGVETLFFGGASREDIYFALASRMIHDERMF